MALIPGLERDLLEAARRQRRRRPRVVLATVAVVTIAALTTLAIAPLGGDEPGSDSATAGGASPALTELLAVFRRPRTTADELPRDPLAELRSTGDAQPGEDPTNSRRVELPPGNVYLWPMDGGVCRSWGTSGGCFPIGVLRTRGVGVATSLIRDPDTGAIDRLEVSGIAIDGIRDVRLIRSGGPDIPVPVTDNAFWVDLRDVDPAPDTIQWEVDGERRSQRLQLF
jgi:hypothetical protein